jgi:hypothetical protein
LDPAVSPTDGKSPGATSGKVTATEAVLTLHVAALMLPVMLMVPSAADASEGASTDPKTRIIPENDFNMISKNN